MDMLHILAIFFMITAMIQQSNNCDTGSNDDTDASNDDDDDDDKKKEDPRKDNFEKCFGDDMSPERVDKDGDDVNDEEPTSDPDDIACSDFDDSCCWGNEKDNDQLDYFASDGDDADGDSMDDCFGTDEKPDGNFLVLVTAEENDGDTNAQYVSCPIECSKTPVIVKLRAWQKDGQIEVCTRPASDSGADPENCEKVSDSSQPGPYEIELPEMEEPFQVIIKGADLTDEDGGILAVDDVEVEFETPCSATTTTEEPEPTDTTTPEDEDDGLCALGCGFEQGEQCSWQPSSSGRDGANQDWVLTDGRVGNRDTGVPGPANGRNYLGAELPKNNAQVVARSPEFNSKGGKKLKFKYYEATQGVTLFCCVDDVSNCPWQSNKDVVITDRNWREGEMEIPEDAHQIIFYSHNDEENYGAVGLDDMEIVDSSGGGGNAC